MTEDKKGIVNESECPPELSILICLIRIWKPDGNNIMKVPESVFMLSEVESIEISESYKQLIDSAVVRFPRGSVLRQTVTSINKDKLAKQLVTGEVDYGDLLVARSTAKTSEPTDFAIGNRIKIELGYTSDPNIALLTTPNSEGKSIYNDTELRAQYEKCLDTMFEGYISECSVESNISIKCQSLAWVLQKKSCPHVPTGKNITVKDLLDENGKYNMLKGTGLALHPETKKIEIDLGKIGFDNNFTVFDIITAWSKFGVYAYEVIENNKAYLRVGRSYFSNASKDSIYQPGSAHTYTVNFDYHVAENSLTFVNTDKKYLAFEAQGMSDKGRFLRVTIRQNPDYPDKTKEKWQFVNEVDQTKKRMKSGGAASAKVNMNNYNIKPYMSRKIGVTMAQLKEEVKKYFEGYVPTGFDGKIVLFGDLKVRSGNIALLIDNQRPQKNGKYLVEEVVTTFGLKGFRQTITLPYLIAKTKNNESKQY